MLLEILERMHSTCMLIQFLSYFYVHKEYSQFRGSVIFSILPVRGAPKLGPGSKEITCSMESAPFVGQEPIRNIS